MKTGGGKISAEKGLDRLNVAEAANLTPLRRSGAEEGRARVLRAPLMRKKVSVSMMKDLEVDDKHRS
jgi:ABC-type arginine transport system ATPase subunit